MEHRHPHGYDAGNYMRNLSVFLPQIYIVTQSLIIYSIGNVSVDGNQVGSQPFAIVYWEFTHEKFSEICKSISYSQECHFQYLGRDLKSTQFYKSKKKISLPTEPQTNHIGARWEKSEKISRQK